MPKPTRGVHSKSQEIPVQPENLEIGYPEEQQYESFEDYDALYGPDAYLGDQYPMTPTGHVVADLFQPFSNQVLSSEPSDEIQQAHALAREEIQSESLEAQERDESQAGQALPLE